MTIDFRKIIAEPPYDDMGREFAETFGDWMNASQFPDTKLFYPSVLKIAEEVFVQRLRLAKKYKTYFVEQVESGGVAHWKNRANGLRSNSPICFSFAMHGNERTKRFYAWTLEQTKKDAEKFQIVTWNRPFTPHFPSNVNFMPNQLSWSSNYTPKFLGNVGEFNFTRSACGLDDNKHTVFIFKHPDNEDVPSLITEALVHWSIVCNRANSLGSRALALATFEWVWTWTNPFIRSGALTMDVLSLLMQVSMGVKIRNNFYHQDCEALLLPYEEYVAKRVNDMLHGFKPRFDMNVA